MIKPPASIRIHQDLEEMKFISSGLDVSQYDKEYEYIRRDLIQPILIRVHLHEARRDDIKLDQIIDEVIQHHENKPNTK